tara:strand:+ start:34 stop:345 length:312 start_codon:yes stop_codon:yes gene_type:complete
MKSSPLDKALVGDQHLLPKTLKDAIEASPGKMVEPMSNVQNQTIQGFNTPMPGNFSPRVQRDAMQVYGTEYDRAMAMPNRGLSEEDIMNSTPLAMRKSCSYKK